MSKQASIEQQFVQEIRAIPDEILAQPVKDSSSILAEECFREGWRDALRGNTIPLSELWDGIDAE
jgi:hypothetical protein